MGADILVMTGDTDDEVTIEEEVFTKHRVRQATDQWIHYVRFTVAVITPEIVDDVPITATR